MLNGKGFGANGNELCADDAERGGQKHFHTAFSQENRKKVWRKYEVDEGTRERDREKKA